MHDPVVPPLIAKFLNIKMAVALAFTNFKQFLLENPIVFFKISQGGTVDMVDSQ